MTPIRVVIYEKQNFGSNLNHMQKLHLKVLRLRTKLTEDTISFSYEDIDEGSRIGQDSTDILLTERNSPFLAGGGYANRKIQTRVATQNLLLCKYIATKT
jgi:hypothetical protein